MVRTSNYGIGTLFDSVQREGTLDDSNTDRSFFPVPTEVSSAAISGRALDFYLACVATDYIPDDDSLQEMYSRGQFEHQQSDLSRDLLVEDIREIKPKASKGRNGKTKIDYDAFGRLVINARSWMNVENVFLHTEAKRRILRLSGYTHLIGAKGERVTIESATDSRVGQTFRNVYKTWQRKP